MSLRAAQQPSENHDPLKLDFSLGVERSYTPDQRAMLAALRVALGLRCALGGRRG